MPGLMGWIGFAVGLLGGCWLVSYPMGGGRIDSWPEYLGIFVMATVFECIVWPRFLGFGWPWPNRGDPSVYGWAVSGWRWVGKRGKSDFPD